MNEEAIQLLRLMDYYHLDARYPDMLEVVRILIENDLMRTDMAKGWIKRIHSLIEKQKLIGNFLSRPPNYEELLPDGISFDVELGHIVERQNVPFGIHLVNGVHHVIITGKSGAGKTVLLRNYVKKIHEFNQQNPGKEVFVIVFDSKRDFEDYWYLFGEDCVKVSVHDKNFKIGLQGPDGVPPAIWINHITTALAARLGLIIARTCLAVLICNSQDLI